MGVYSEYLKKNLDIDSLEKERKKQLSEISRLRGGRDILVYAADLNKQTNLIALGYSDLLPISDQLSNLSGEKVDVILETPGGLGEVAEDIVKLLHGKYKEVGIIIPGYAKSAGTIIAMAADEILMGKLSALGPIDAQLSWQGKQFSAHALIRGMDKIKEEVEKTNILNKAYIPMLQGVSPGELESAQNALDFAKNLVTDWLKSYKFKDWKVRESSGKPVTEEYKHKRAEEIAEKLCNHSEWKTHSRSIKVEDLEAMGIKITDYSENKSLEEALTRYYTLLQMTFATNIYKVFETLESQVYRFITSPINNQQLQLQQGLKNIKNAVVDLTCNKCKAVSKIQASFDKNDKIINGNIPFPKDNKLKCPSCGTEHNLLDLRRQIELQAKRKIIN